MHSDYPVVLIHPLAADSSIWHDVVAGLEPRRVLTIDVPGHGRRPVSERPWTMSGLAAEVVALMDEAGYERAHVAGMSLGGTAALQFAVDHPSRIAGCVAADCVPHYPAPVAGMLRARVDEARAAGMSAIADGVMGTWFTEETETRAPDVVERARAGFVATPAEAYAMAVDALIGTDLRDGIRHIACPTLLVYGDADLPAMKEAALSMASDIRGARLLWLAGAHAAPIERPLEFARAVADFVDSVEAD